MPYKDLIKSWHEGVLAADNKDYDLALKILRSIEDPTAKIWFNIGCIHLVKGELLQALEAYDKSVIKDRCLAVGYFQRSYIYFKLQRYDKAVGDCHLALAQLRNNIVIDYKQLGLRYLLYSWEVLYNTAAALCYLQRWQSAEDKLKEAMDWSPRESGRNPKIDAALDAVKDNEYLLPVHVPQGELFRPRKQEVEQLNSKDFLGKPKVISSVVPNDQYSGFEPLRLQKPGFYEPCRDAILGNKAGYHRVLVHHYPETSGITVKANSVLFVLNKDGEWATAIHDGQKILIPTNILEPVTAPKADIKRMNNGIPMPPMTMPPTRPNVKQNEEQEAWLHQGNPPSFSEVIPPRPRGDPPEPFMLNNFVPREPKIEICAPCATGTSVEIAEHPREDLLIERAEHPREDLLIERAEHPREDLLIERAEHPREDLLIERDEHPREDLLIERDEHPREDLLIERDEHPRKDLLIERDEHPRKDLLIERDEHPREDLLIERDENPGRGPAVERLVPIKTAPLTERGMTVGPARPDSKTERSINTRTDPAAESSINTRTDPAAERSVNTRTDPAAESSINTRTDPAAERSVNTRTDPAAERSINTRTDPAAERSVNTRTDPAAERSVNTRTDPAAERSVNTRTDPAAERSVYTRTDPAAERSVYTRTDPAAERSVYTRTDPAAERSVNTRTDPAAERSVNTRTDPAAERSVNTRTDPAAERSVNTRTDPAAERSVNTRTDPAAERSLTVTTDVVEWPSGSPQSLHGADSETTVQVHTEFTVSLKVKKDISYPQLQEMLRTKLRQHGGHMDIQLSYRDSAGKVLTVGEGDGDLQGMLEQATTKRMMFYCQDAYHCMGRPVLYRMTALYQYSAEGPEDLTFNPGDIIDILSEVNEEWLEGHCGGNIGIFPKCFASRFRDY
ncbi:NADPH oxidase activator 1 [Pelodytes ibericus]